MVHTYSNDKNVYSVDLMLAYINIFKPKYTKVNINDHLSVFNYKGWSSDIDRNTFYSPNDVLNNPKKYKKEYTKIMNANLKYPIIINDNKIIDGVHRFSKAYLINKKTIKAYNFNKEELNRFLIDKNLNWDKIDKLSISDHILLFYKRFV